MSERIINWGTHEWQKYINSLLHVHHRLYNEVYIEIPDKTHGDAGLEGYSTGGHAYQCYADQDSINAAERARKQKKKIDDDLPKLLINKDFWAQTLGTTKLNFWFLVVPALEDKSILTHAQKKGLDLRKKRLPFLAANFQASVCTPEQFPEAFNVLARTGVAKLHLPAPEATDAEISSYESTSPNLVNTLDEKLARMQHQRTAEERAEHRKALLKVYIQSANMLDRLRQTAPPVWEAVRECIGRMAQSTAMASRFDPAAPEKRFMSTFERLRTELASTAQALNDRDIDDLAWGTVALWLLECPLNFPQSTGHAALKS